VLVCLVLGGCTTTLQDVEGITAEVPDTVRVFMNADQFPNLNIVCVVGDNGYVVGLLNTTRDYQQTVELSTAATEALCNGEAGDG
jgi:hypothetical protein